jgi:dipicolinate synthase subunit B
MTGSFCTFSRAFEAWKALREAGAELFPIMSPSAMNTDTRFYSAADAQSAFQAIAGREIWSDLNEVEPIGPKKLLDLVIVAPCTGNTLAKLAGGVTDNAAVMAAKSHLRNGGPVLVGPSTNDGLGRSAENIGRLMNMRGMFLVPFRQDDWRNKPDSLVADFRMLPESAAAAMEGRQLQPVLLGSPDGAKGNERIL